MAASKTARITVYCRMAERALRAEIEAYESMIDLMRIASQDGIYIEDHHEEGTPHHNLWETDREIYDVSHAGEELFQTMKDKVIELSPEYVENGKLYWTPPPEWAKIERLQHKLKECYRIHNREDNRQRVLGGKMTRAQAARLEHAEWGHVRETSEELEARIKDYAMEEVAA